MRKYQNFAELSDHIKFLLTRGSRRSRAEAAADSDSAADLDSRSQDNASELLDHIARTYNSDEPDTSQDEATNPSSSVVSDADDESSSSLAAPARGRWQRAAAGMGAAHASQLAMTFPLTPPVRNDPENDLSHLQSPDTPGEASAAATLVLVTGVRVVQLTTYHCYYTM